MYQCVNKIRCCKICVGCTKTPFLCGKLTYAQQDIHIPMTPLVAVWTKAKLYELVKKNPHKFAYVDFLLYVCSRN